MRRALKRKQYKMNNDETDNPFEKVIKKVKDSDVLKTPSSSTFILDDEKVKIISISSLFFLIKSKIKLKIFFLLIEIDRSARY